MRALRVGQCMASTKLIFSLFLGSLFIRVDVDAHPNYIDALEKSILFFQGQRSGRLPPDQKITWRSDSGLTDGSSANVNLTGGYYDAGDNVKFGFPMAFTTTILSWSIIEYGTRMGPQQLNNARATVRWATDYLLKASTATADKLYVGVGDPNTDHQCWERPEDMDTPRTVYSVSPANPGSDVAGETAAALAATSLVFRAADKSYSRELLMVAKMVMKFAMHYQGKYSDSLGPHVCPYYCSYSGYKDELLWGASWLLRATNDKTYLKDIQALGANEDTDIFSWDNKLAGARVLLSRRTLVDKDNSFDSFRIQAENFICKVFPNSPSSTTHYTPGGLMYKMSSSNLQYVTSITFLLSTYAKYMISSNHTFNCNNNIMVTSKSLRTLAKKQVDYILGENPLKMSYMVGFGTKFPQRVHHRGSSLPSLASHPSRIGCQAGFEYLHSNGPNPNMLTGAVIGGPDQNDEFLDDRTDYQHSEPATYINAPLVGSLAYLVGSYGTG